jgi:hypothetical protein
MSRLLPRAPVRSRFSGKTEDAAACANQAEARYTIAAQSRECQARGVERTTWLGGGGHCGNRQKIWLVKNKVGTPLHPMRAARRYLRVRRCSASRIPEVRGRACAQAAGASCASCRSGYSPWLLLSNSRRPLSPIAAGACSPAVFTCAAWYSASRLPGLVVLFKKLRLRIPTGQCWSTGDPGSGRACCSTRGSGLQVCWFASCWGGLCGLWSWRVFPPTTFRSFASERTGEDRGKAGQGHQPARRPNARLDDKVVPPML